MATVYPKLAPLENIYPYHFFIHPSLTNLASLSS